MRILHKKELGCCATSAAVLKEEDSSVNANTRKDNAFWEVLGGKKAVKGESVHSSFAKVMLHAHILCNTFPHHVLYLHNCGSLILYKNVLSCFVLLCWINLHPLLGCHFNSHLVQILQTPDLLCIQLPTHPMCLCACVGRQTSRARLLKFVSSLVIPIVSNGCLYLVYDIRSTYTLGIEEHCITFVLLCKVAMVGSHTLCNSCNPSSSYL